jgi:hypothetical protein
MANIQKFINYFEIFLDSFDFPSFDTFPNLFCKQEYERLSIILDLSREFVELYIKCNLNDFQKIKIIEEFGMKKLIDLHCKYEGNSICLDLLHFDEHIDQWIIVLLLHVVNLYP